MVEGDAQFSRWLTMEMEAQSGIDVHSYFTAKEALAEMPVLKPKAVLIVQSPGMQQSLMQIRSVMPDVQIMVLSEKRNVDEAVGLIRSGADTCIFRNEQLINVLTDRMYEA